VLLVRALRTSDARRRRALLVATVLAIAAPLAWMLWNARVHGSAVHFLHRVASYRRAVGQGAGGDVVGALLLYPRLFVTTRPELVTAVLLTAPALASRELRSRWAVPLACGAASVAFLAYGALNDGAPTHHPERALLLAFLIVAAFAGDAICTLHAMRPRLFVPVAAVTTGLVLVSLRPLVGARPGATPAEDRSAQMARGRALSEAAHLVLTPGAYEHFALVAAYGAPERVEVLPRAPDASDCPSVVASPSR
jgi:hypothetical protein